MFSFLQQKVSHRFLQFLLILSISILCGLVWFLLLYGHYSLRFSNVDWIYLSGGDVFQHQIGWEWFRQEPWHFPIGRIDAYGYPFGTFISYTDSIPLLAIPMKLLSPLLNHNFQFLGFWELISVIGQMYFGMKIIGEFTTSYPKRILGASLLVLSPILMYRAFNHNSLTAQWILLAGIWFIILEYRRKLWRGAWIILFITAVLVHLYFVAMLVPLWLISLFFHYKRENKKWMVIVDLFTVPVLTLVVGYCIGLFTLSVGDLLGAGFGLYSWNLNEFLNPGKFSSILHQLPMSDEGQYEGYSYLGFGNLLILPITLILFFKKDYSKSKLFFFLPFVIVSILLILFSLSNKAFLNAQPIWDIQLTKRMLNICALFRASGRFIWPVFYFIVLFGVIGIIRNTRYSIPIIIFAILLQFFDTQPLFTSKRFNSDLNYKSPLQAEFWKAAALNNKHVFLIPASKAHSIYEPFALYARKNKMTLNWGYFSRANLGAIKNFGNQVWEDLKVNKADKETLFIFWDPEWDGLVKDNLSDKMLVCQVDGYTVVLSKDNELVHTDFELSQYCSFP